MDYALSVKLLHLLFIWIQVNFAQNGLLVKLVMGIRNVTLVNQGMTNIIVRKVVDYYQANQIVLRL